VPLRWSPPTKTYLCSASAMTRRRCYPRWLDSCAVQPPARDRWTLRKRANMRWRSLTRRARTLPDFLVLSGGRCGSTSLFAILCEHRQVLAPAHKEVHFFDRNYLEGEDFYRRLFPLRMHRRLRARRAGAPVLSGEATTYYLLHPDVPRRAYDVVPDAKLVAILRDPVDRAYSHYQLSVRNGDETLSFEEALDAEPGRISGAEERLLADPAYDHPAHRVNTYIERGFYLDGLLRWERFYGRERLLVLRSEDFFADPLGEVRRVTDFLGIAPHGGPLPEPRNVAMYEGMLPETRRRLQEIYAEPNRRLEEHLGRDLGWQKPGDAP
jgi:hypothetical protein